MPKDRIYEDPKTLICKCGHSQKEHTHPSARIEREKGRGYGACGFFSPDYPSHHCPHENCLEFSYSHTMESNPRGSRNVNKTLYQDILNKRKYWVEAREEVERERERLEEEYEFVNDDELDWDEVTYAAQDWVHSVVKYFREVFDASEEWSGGGSVYLDVFDDNEEQNDWIKIRVADHPQKYDADYSIELTDKKFWQDNLDMAIEASKKIQADG